MNDSASLPRLAEFTHTADSVNLLFARSLSEDYTDTSSEWITYITRTILVASSVPVIAVETNATPAETNATPAETTTETPTTTTPETTSKTTTDTTADTTHCLFTSTLLSLRAPSFPLVSPAQVLFLFYCLKVCDTNTRSPYAARLTPSHHTLPARRVLPPALARRHGRPRRRLRDARRRPRL